MAIEASYSTPKPVVIADNDPDFLTTVRMALKDLGLRVTAAHSLDDLVGIARSLTVSPVLLIGSCQLHGGITATEITARSRNNFGNDLPVAILRGQTIPERLSEVQDAASRLLRMSVNRDALREILTDLIRPRT